MELEMTLTIESRQFGKEFCVVRRHEGGREQEVFISYSQEEAEAFIAGVRFHERETG